MLHLALLFLFTYPCVTVDPLLNQFSTNEDLAKYCFEAEFSYKEIIRFLLMFHGLTISARHLHRFLRKKGLFRRYNFASTNSVILAVRKTLKGSGANFGYSAVHQKLRMEGITTSHEMIRLIMKTLDPEGVKLRTAHRLKWGKFISPWPNYTWHINGYDKLKPCGFPIHAAIDGYSRKILWLLVSYSSNDPNVVSSYFINCTGKLKLLSTIIRSDRGYENTVIGGIQMYLRQHHWDNFSGEKSFWYGSSIDNQRIESWWSFFRKHISDW